MTLELQFVTVLVEGSAVNLETGEEMLAPHVLVGSYQRKPTVFSFYHDARIVEIEEVGLSDVIAAGDMNSENMAAIAEENLNAAIEDIENLPEERRMSEMRKLERQKRRRGSLASLTLSKEERQKLNSTTKSTGQGGKNRRQSIFEQLGGLVGAGGDSVMSAARSVNGEVAPRSEPGESKERAPRLSLVRRSTITANFDRTESSKSEGRESPIKAGLAPGRNRTGGRTSNARATGARVDGLKQEKGRMFKASSFHRPFMGKGLLSTGAEKLQVSLLEMPSPFCVSSLLSLSLSLSLLSRCHLALTSALRACSPTPHQSITDPKGGRGRGRRYH